MEAECTGEQIAERLQTGRNAVEVLTASREV